MLFETIDPKNYCKNIVVNNDIESYYDIKDLTGTWSYHSAFRNI